MTDERKEVQIERLLDAAFSELQHDTGPQNKEYVFQRKALKSEFQKILRAELAQLAQAEPVVFQMTDELFRLLESTLQYYGAWSDARLGDRIGGVVEGCPRGTPYIDSGEYADKAQAALQEWAEKCRANAKNVRSLTEYDRLAQCPVVWGPEKQAVPGGPIYRVGESTGVILPPQPESEEGK